MGGLVFPKSLFNIDLPFTFYHLLSWAVWTHRRIYIIHLDCHSMRLLFAGNKILLIPGLLPTYSISLLANSSESGIFETEGLPNNVSRISTFASQTIPTSVSFHQIQEDGHFSDLRVRCSVPSFHIAAISPLDAFFPLSSVPKLVSTSQNAVALSNFSLAPENIHSGISFHEVASNTPADAFSVPQPFQGGFGIATTNGRQHLLPGDLASQRTFPTPQTPKSFGSIEEIPWTGLQHTSSSDDHSLEGSTSTTTRSNPNASGTTSPNPIQCTWAACSKTFLTRSEYSHHSKNHSRPFQCNSCPARHATKRQLDRHTNEKHNTAEKYYCTVSTCGRSLARQGKPFPRDDGYRKHMRSVHGMTDEQVKDCGMDERMRMIRLARKIGRRIGG